MASNCENKGDVVRRVKRPANRGNVIPLVTSLLPKPQFGNSDNVKRPLTIDNPSSICKKQKLSDPREVVSQVASPSLAKMLSQDDSFFEQYIDQIDDHGGSDTDMFGDSDDGESAENSDSKNILSPIANSSVCSVDSQSPSLSLPMSVLDVRMKALEELRKKPLLTQKEQKHVSQPSKLVKDKVDVGPFYGLPSVVGELYHKHKGVKELFPWQVKCLSSAPVKNKTNLLYSLPTSGGKTMVAEIIMLQEILCYKRNVVFVLPYVSLVQEKIRSLTPFALELGFHLEEYAGSRGKFPPVKRRHKQNLFICTIEKAHSLFNSLVAEGRESELGLVVVDEVHMLGEQGRGANLESFLTKLSYVSEKRGTEVQLVAMSATVGNLSELATFLKADLFTDKYRPVELREFVKVGRDVMEVKSDEGEQFKFCRKVSEAEQLMKQIDEDAVSQLVLEVFPEHSVLLFCDSKKRCENVSEMVAKVISISCDKKNSIIEFKQKEKMALLSALSSEGSGFICPTLRRTIPYGLAYHHSGLTMDERKLLEEAFLSGTIGVICCTSTLAAGVNLPARRVIIRSPFMGRNQLTNAQYKQMVGRAGRAGMDTHGESFLLVKENLTRIVPDIVVAPVEKCFSSLHTGGGRGLPALILNCLYLGLISTPGDINDLLNYSLMSLQTTALSLPPISSLVSEALQYLLTNTLVMAADETDLTQQVITTGTALVPTKQGRACVNGNIDLSWSNQLYSDLASARAGLAVDTSLHLLYLVTPYDIAQRSVYSASVFHNIYMDLAEPELAVARGLGVTEGVMVGLIMGRGGKKLEPVLSRLYYALMLLDLWKAVPIHTVAEKYQVSRGEVQSLMTSAASFSSCVFHFCQEVEEFWAYQELLEPFSRRLAHCCSPELLPLLDLPSVQAGRARQLHSAGFTGVGDIARASAKDLVGKVEHLSYKAAHSIIQGAKLIMLEKVETLRDQAETAMLDMGGEM